MRHTKKWGTVNSGAELYMLAHAERTRKELERREKSVKHNYQEQLISTSARNFAKKKPMYKHRLLTLNTQFFFKSSGHQFAKVNSIFFS